MYAQNSPMNRDVLIRRNKLFVAEFLGKPIVLVTAIVRIVTAVIGVVLSVFATSITVSTFGDLFQDFINEITSNSNIDVELNSSINISAPLGAFVTFLAFLLMYLGAKNIDKSTSKIGLIIYRVLGIIALVAAIAAVVLSVFCILFFLFVVLMISNGGINEISSEIPDFNAPTLVLFFVMLAIMFVILLIYTLLCGISFYSFTKSLYKSYTTETLSAKGAKFYAILNIFSVILPLLLAVIELIMIPFVGSRPFYHTEYSHYFIESSSIISILIIGAVSELVSVISPITNAVLALSYNKHIRSAGVNGEYLPMPTMPTAQAVYPATQYDTPVAPAQYADAVTSEPVASEAPVTPEAPVVEQPTATVTAPESETPITEVNPYAMPEPLESVQSAPEQSAKAQSADSFCSNCGNRIAPEQNFCNYCGKRLK